LTRSRLELGKTGEDWAADHLLGLGYRIVERNYRCPLGEIDVVATDRDCLVFVEIKTRRAASMGQVKEAVTVRKQKKLVQLARYYLKEHKKDGVRCRFDVVAVNTAGGARRIEVVRDAFTA